jgi:nucleoside-diphosphate-sugar epimerase
MSSPLNRVLVTGSNGFVGRAAVESLRSAGADVIGISSRDVNLLDREQTARLVRDLRATHLLHLAWYTEHGAYWSSPLNEEWVEASVALFEAFIAAGGRRIVGAGTCAEYDWSGGVCSEATTPIAPVSIYGRAKARLNAMLESMARGMNVSHAWARLFFLYGPHEAPRRFVASTIRGLLAGERVVCRSPNLIRDFLFIGDAGDALARIVLHEASGAVNVGSGAGVRLSGIASLIAAKIGDDGVIFEDANGGEAPMVVADVTRLREDFGFSPRIDLERGLDAAIDWWRHR